MVEHPKYMVVRLNKRNGRYIIGSLSTLTKTAPEAIAYGKREAQTAGWLRIIPPGEIDAANVGILRAWETYASGGIAAIVDNPAYISHGHKVSPIGGAP